MSTLRVTLAQIATRAKVHVTTVSLALRDSARLSAATRTRIQNLAREMGYIPDPALSALVAYRGTIQAPSYQSTVAWFNNYPNRQLIHGIHSFRDYLAGAEQRAEELGYKLEEFWQAAPNLSSAALSRNLIARGIRGIMVFPLAAPGSLLDFPWHDFSALALGYSLKQPKLHRVSNHQFNSALILLRELRLLGYRRIGYFIPEDFDLRVNRGPSCAYYTYDRNIPAEERIPLLFQRDFNDATGLAEWIEQYRPEVIVTQDLRLRDWFIARKFRIPEDIGLAYINIDPAEQLLSGMSQNDHQIGRAALDFIVAMMHRNERGIPPVAQNMLLDGEWIPRQTTRKVGPPAPWLVETPLGLDPAPAHCRPMRA
jgi:DNA-binding LacI/PurR family transcriptional regulator